MTGVFPFAGAGRGEEALLLMCKSERLQLPRPMRGVSPGNARILPRPREVLL